MVDFNEDTEAYHTIGLGDLLAEKCVMHFTQEMKDVQEARLASDGHYYYTESGTRVIIDTGSMFYIPLEKMLTERT